MEASWEANEIERWVMNTESLYVDAKRAVKHGDLSNLHDVCGAAADMAGIKASTADIQQAAQMVREAL